MARNNIKEINLGSLRKEIRQLEIRVSELEKMIESTKKRLDKKVREIGKKAEGVANIFRLKR